MGLIARRFADAEAVRNDAGWLNRDDGEEMGRPSVSGVRVTKASALGLTTVWRCVDLISHAVSLAPTDVVVKVGKSSFPENVPPRWMVEPDPSNPNYMAGDYFGDVTMSMLTEGNFFTHVFPHVFDPQVLTVVSPGRVDVRPGPLYDIRDGQGKVIRTVGPMEMLHGWWLKLPGELRGISPLEALRRGIGGAIAAEDHAARFFGQGAALSFGVEVPGTLDNQKRLDLQASLREKHAGNKNAHAIGVLTGGAKFVTGLAPTPEQAQMLATRKFSVEDLCRPYGVPPGMAGSQEPGASSYASALVWREQFRDDAVLKFTTKIERQHSRLLEMPANITSPNATIQMRFNLDWIARTDLLARYQAHAAGVQGGFITPDEARAYEDKAPLPGGDQLYMQQQMVPISDASYAALGALVRAGFDPEDAMAKLKLEPIKHLGLVPVTVQADPAEAA